MSLGGDRRAAMKALPQAVATLQQRIAAFGREETGARLGDMRSPLTTHDFGRAVWSRYSAVLAEDDEKRARQPSKSAIEDEVRTRANAILDDPRFTAEGVDLSNPLARLDATLEALAVREAQRFDHEAREIKLKALRQMLVDGETALVEHEIDDFLTRNALTAARGSSERTILGKNLMRAEIEAIERSLERDQGLYGGQPSDPLVKQPADLPTGATVAPLPIKELFKDYIAARQAVGKHKDGAVAWETAILHLVKFVGHADARRITKRNLLDWRDKLAVEGKSPKTIADKYLASVRAIFRWAFENDRLSTNEAETVRQPIGKKQHSRERGYTTTEATAVLVASLQYRPAKSANPSNRESAHISAAKQWLPLLCAFTGARVTEMAQLRTEDIREEQCRWVLRVSPDAGSVKAGGYRDVPIHRQVVELGFIDFARSAKNGPLFHAGKTSSGYLKAARATAGRVSQWLQNSDLVPEGVQPSHGWRHRFKTQARELGQSDRIADAIQGHAGRSASDDYGDVSIVAKARLIDALPGYQIHHAAGVSDRKDQLSAK
ncbi:site-specific integrase [Paracoccus ravus]|uniref:site-specific integrase n=1 Tax=Paracoccus ravus TaxID=2447760 RepID=UPI00106E82DE|nr:site-specific integrase [Paracoccus ravus]